MGWNLAKLEVLNRGAWTFMWLEGFKFLPFLFIVDNHVTGKVAMLDSILLDQDIKVLWMNLIFIIMA